VTFVTLCIPDAFFVSVIGITSVSTTRWIFLAISFPIVRRLISSAYMFPAYLTNDDTYFPIFLIFAVRFDSCLGWVNFTHFFSAPHFHSILSAQSRPDTLVVRNVQQQTSPEEGSESGEKPGQPGPPNQREGVSDHSIRSICAEQY
jgi:hypothetical protein